MWAPLCGHSSRCCTRDRGPENSMFILLQFRRPEVQQNGGHVPARLCPSPEDLGENVFPWLVCFEKPSAVLPSRPAAWHLPVSPLSDL